MAETNGLKQTPLLPAFAVSNNKAAKKSWKKQQLQFTVNQSDFLLSNMINSDVSQGCQLMLLRNRKNNLPLKKLQHVTQLKHPNSNVIKPSSEQEKIQDGPP